jgi:hypothetical protein
MWQYETFLIFLYKTSMSNIKPEMRINAFGSPTASPMVE